MNLSPYPARPLRPGDFAIVWEDHVTRRLPEGVARLLRMVECGCLEDYEAWQVAFLHDGSFGVRFVATGDRVDLGSFAPPPRAGRRGNPLAN